MAFSSSAVVVDLMGGRVPCGRWPERRSAQMGFSFLDARGDDGESGDGVEVVVERSRRRAGAGRWARLMGMVCERMPRRTEPRQAWQISIAIIQHGRKMLGGLLNAMTSDALLSRGQREKTWSRNLKIGPIKVSAGRPGKSFIHVPSIPHLAS